MWLGDGYSGDNDGGRGGCLYVESVCGGTHFKASLFKISIKLKSSLPCQLDNSGYTQFLMQ